MQSSSNSFTVQIVAAPPPLTASFQLTTAVGGTSLPYTIGYAFPKTAFAGGTALTVDQGTAQVIVKRTWNDGSIKHVVVSGHVTIAGAGGTQAIQIAAGTPSGGTALTSASIQTAAPTASIQCGSIGTVSLVALLATPFRTWISGPEMVECHYRGQVGTDPTLVAWFHVRLYKSGRMWVRAFCENGYVTNSQGTNINKTYAATAVIGGTTAFSNASFTHYGHTRWDAEGWIGGDPQITPKHNVAQLISTKLVPNYWKRNPSSAVLSGLAQTYTPNSNLLWTLTMGDTGFQNQIGLLPLWDALYCTSTDPRAWRAVVAQTRALNSYGIVWREPADNLPTRPSVRPDWAMAGQNQGGSATMDTGSLSWEPAHHGSGGYLAYLITGDYYFLETMQHQASTIYLIQSTSYGSGTSRQILGQSRALAWGLRSIGQFAAIGPLGGATDTGTISVTNDYIALFGSNMDHWRSQLPDQNPGQNTLGILYCHELEANDYGTGLMAPWQQHFVIQSTGHLSDIEPLASMTNHNLVRDYYYNNWMAGILGTSGAANYCYNHASEYNIQIASGSSMSLVFANWGAVFQATFAAANGSCPAGTALGGGGSGDPTVASTGYYGNLMPAIAHGVDHGGGLGSGSAADQAWTRFSGASNFATVANSGFDDCPIWGVVPRGFGGT
jgi:hypothetical protein